MLEAPILKELYCLHHAHGTPSQTVPSTERPAVELQAQMMINEFVISGAHTRCTHPPPPPFSVDDAK